LGLLFGGRLIVYGGMVIVSGGYGAGGDDVSDGGRKEAFLSLAAGTCQLYKVASRGDGFVSYGSQANGLLRQLNSKVFRDALEVEDHFGEPGLVLELPLPDPLDI
jgi:hypothetical protein